MQTYDGLNAYVGDIHNHCGISYGHGTIDEALANARERLDFCAVTGHAHWPDMPADPGRIQYVIDFHIEGFAKLAEGWVQVQEAIQQANAPGEFVTFGSFEVHSLADGDYTVLYRDGLGEILRDESIPAMHERIAAMNADGTAAIAVPHHLGYLRGRRGLNWDTFRSDISPVVEMISMHGCSESTESTRPYMHVMGPSDYRSTVQCGLAQGHTFGVIGSTDHHSAHPGSYGHGLAGVWAEAKTREAIWDAIVARRTWAMTGDRIDLQFAVNGAPMGAEIAKTDSRDIHVNVVGGAAIDYVDIIKNNRLWRRISPCEVAQPAEGETFRTLIYLELGWSDRGRQVDWDVSLSVDGGRVLSIDPRFRGQEVVSPVEKEDGSSCDYHSSHWALAGENGVAFRTMTCGNPNSSTSATQGLCMEVEMPADGNIQATLNDQSHTIPLARLRQGALVGDIEGWHSPAFRFHRAPREWEYRWTIDLADDEPGDGDPRDVYYARVRQVNDQWAWSSPVFLV